MTKIQPAPVRRAITVKAPQARAFEVFTAGLGRWWPPTHKIGAADFKTACIEPRAEGRWYEVGVDGSECDWGKVLVWEPPSRVVLAWQINGQWSYDPDLITEVEVKFTADGENQTRVELEHRNLERFGEHAEEIRGIFESAGGWTGTLERYAVVAAGGSV